MKKAGDNEQLRLPTLGYSFAYVAHLGRFMQHYTKHLALYEYLFFETVCGYW